MGAVIRLDDGGKARHDKMVEFTRRAMSDERGTMNARRWRQGD
jgi:hypothetical protein